MKIPEKTKTSPIRNPWHAFCLLWATQSLSHLGSAMTEFALTLWLYEKTGSALSTAALTVCTYAPYIAMSILAGALTDRLDRKKTMLVCDAMAALGTVIVFVLYRMDLLSLWHLYAINIVSGFMNTVQQPASEVACTQLVPREKYARMSSLQSLSGSVTSIGSPVIASMLYGISGLDMVIAVDLLTFALAFVTLLRFIHLPGSSESKENRTGILEMAKEGLVFLRNTPLILNVILFMAGVNFIASAFDAVLPALILPSPRGGNRVLGIVNACAGLAMVLGSLMTTALPKPRDRVRAIYLTMLFSLGTENFLLAFSRQPAVWCAAQVIGWILVPVMQVNLNVILRSTVPMPLQGRVYACRNTLQFFTIPIGLLFGGSMVDAVCEPFMAASENRFLPLLFGSGKGSGAALMMAFLGISGVLLCLAFGRRLKRYHYED